MATQLACDAGSVTQYQGGLYFVQGSYLMRFSLSDGSVSVEVNLGDKKIRSMDVIGSRRLLLSESATVNGEKVHRISWLDLKSYETEVLYAGLIARFLTESNLLVYDDGVHLYAIPQETGIDNTIIFSHPGSRVTSLVETGFGQVLFAVNMAGETSTYLWDGQGPEPRRMNALNGVCRLEGAVWVSTLNQLVCKPRDESISNSRYILVDLDGNVHSALNLPPDKNFLALAFIENQNALVLQETWHSLMDKVDRHAVWMYDFKLAILERINKNTDLGNSVVFASY